MYDNQRTGVIRTLSMFFLVWTVFGPIDASLIEFKTKFLGYSVLNSIELFWILKPVLVITSLALFKWPKNLTLSGIQLVSGSLFLCLGVVSNSLWNYNTHILIIATLAFISGLRVELKHDGKTIQKDLATALSLIFATIYFQAAVSKLVVSGLDWMNSGLSIYIHMLKFNPALSSILDGSPILFRLAGWLTVTGELFLGSLFVIPRTRKRAAIVSISFHIMLWFAFHISFWHLWIFYPALYFSWNKDTLFIRLIFKKPVLKAGPAGPQNKFRANRLGGNMGPSLAISHSQNTAHMNLGEN